MARKTGSGDETTTRGSTGVTRRQEPGATTRRWQSPAYGSPFYTMRRMAEDMDRMFGNIGFGRSGMLGPALFDRDAWSGGRDLETVWTPQIETFRRGDQLVVRADLPGMNKDNVDVEIENGILRISGERREEHEEERDEYYRSERSYGRFQRSIALPDGVDEDQCNARFTDGVLEVTVPAPRERQQQAKRIDVK
jgi:HSP20 family protein